MWGNEVAILFPRRGLRFQGNHPYLLYATQQTEDEFDEIFLESRFWALMFPKPFYRKSLGGVQVLIGVGPKKDRNT
ncbi:MAG: hypothetical protein CMJ96_04775 [Planctomycetes bacterium]|nr:hypothetical protein [Planctomycetota bacterium]